VQLFLANLAVRKII